MKLNRKLTLFVSMFVSLAAALGAFGATKTSAIVNMSPDPAFNMPADLYNYLRYCDNPATQSPAYVQWISAPGRPAVQEITVPWGTTSVNLDLRFAGTVCFQPSSTMATQLRVMGSPFPGAESAYNRTLSLVFEPRQNVKGAFSSAGFGFQFAPPGGFVTPGDYFIQLDNRPISRFQSGIYRCVAPPGNQVNGYDQRSCAVSYSLFRIRVNLTNIPQPTTLQCGSVSITRGGAAFTPESGEEFRITANFTTSGGRGPNVISTMWMSLNGPPGPGRFTDRVAALFVPVARPNGSGQGTLPNGIHPQAISISQPGVYSGSYRVAATDATNSPITCPFTVRVVAKPYHRVYGGDVFAGGGFETAAGCTGVSSATVLGFNRGGNPYLGSGSQLATFALAFITDFATGQIRNNASDPNQLSFANYAPVLDDGWPAGQYGVYGGGLGPGNAVCAPDYFADRNGTDPGATLNLTPATNGNYNRTGSLRLTSAAIGLGANNHVTIYVDGDVFIGNNITFRNSGLYNNASEIPSLRVIVRGNIFVEPGVQQIEGIFIAQPRASVPRSGWFYTCGSQSWGSRTPPFAPNVTDLNGACRTTKLRVYGAVIADTIKLTRSSGTLSGSSLAERYNAGGDPAEVFIYSPEVWLGGELPGGEGTFDAVTALPPVL